MSGVTARTLRYYDEIGLLQPARVGANGYRYYEHAELLRLQEILLLRELGLDLATIGAVVNAQHDPIEALRRYHLRLVEERARLDRLSATVAATIQRLEEGIDMPVEDLFKGFEFSPEYIEREAHRARDTRDQRAVTEMQRITADWGDEEFRSFNAEGAQLESRMLALLRDGVAHDDEAAFEVLDEDLALQRKVWSPDRDGYVRLAEALTEPSEWNAHMVSLDPRLPAYLRDAMLAYANARMQ
ncbi:MerR family transcriptional regulator [Mycolicibacterium litorale]|uniref:MerR family transcriptional regulator n=1 Tax=Mycolicibacterium litorale TaxID=758802 RepID=UPI0018D6328A|nr:MerR family transcriptional regulator [Mycolicibacterium litorale]